MNASSSAPAAGYWTVTAAQTGDDQASAARRAAAGRALLAEADRALLRTVMDLDDAAVAGPSRVPGWTRAHVLTHLSRQADAASNLLLWARTGVEHTPYPSLDDRDADIVEGADRSWRLLVEDVLASSQRFAHAVANLPPEAWAVRLTDDDDQPLPAEEVPWLRLCEVWIHLVDLDSGLDFPDVPEATSVALVEHVMRRLTHHRDTEPLVVVAGLPDGSRHRWHVPGREDLPAQEVWGPLPEMLAWLAGRSEGRGLTGRLPALPSWF
ncbi:maleylpyruvate isomerase family mycothiol-dependent enzyme [Actinoalloteichus sp. AHMU CJ021]|uniref:maleylpyruvate isomerase family mycothiol-dependent enzyme n=1 Tax=Actinoalloteichus TaxID=65496 RepID=UPI000691FC19|nr:maleylpyruvate isomerase family mycothiol-dependent enzyme [Actinoalloteichus caeruleus]AUS77691.1 maleylpyruvate isomerase family mycothiol-dependent enzyme [Actinoalloteichus sp. AHMU CJ021]